MAEMTSSDLDILGNATPARPMLQTGVSNASTLPPADSTTPSPSAGLSPSQPVLQGLMDQAGLFELFLASDNSHTSIPTRAIGDPSTGTHALPSNATTPQLERAMANVGPAHSRDATSLTSLESAPPHPASSADQDEKPPSPERPPLHVEASSQTVVARRAPSPPSIALPPANLLAPLRLSPVPSPARVPSPPPPAVAALVQAGRPAAPARTMTPPSAPMPVLVVDDDPLTRMLMKRMLTRLGCAVTTAENGLAALEALLVPTAPGAPTPQSEDAPRVVGAGDVGSGAWSADCKFAVVFLDNQMPVMSGIEAVAKLRAAGRRDLVVGVTGKSPTSDNTRWAVLINNVQAMLYSVIKKSILKLVLISEPFFVVCVWLRLTNFASVLTKPVLERSLKGMLETARGRRAAKPPLQ